MPEKKEKGTTSYYKAHEKFSQSEISLSCSVDPDWFIGLCDAHCTNVSALKSFSICFLYVGYMYCAIYGATGGWYFN